MFNPSSLSNLAEDQQENCSVTVETSGQAAHTVAVFEAV